MAQWISGNRYLSQSEMENNALLVYGILKPLGWSVNAIAGVLGNMQEESTINPAIWEQFKVQGYINGRKAGFGLIGWTPWTFYTDWADAKGVSWENGYWQVMWIHTETSPKNWSTSHIEYKMSFEDFKKSTSTPEALAVIYLYNAEKPADPSASIDDRRQQARNWYNFLLEHGSDNSSIIEKAIKWCHEIANDESHGYDQGNRWGPDYDCSSFVITAYQEAGCPVKTNGASSTADMCAAFVASGFNELDYVDGMEMIRGDVLWRRSDGTGHTEIYIGLGQNIGAHINEAGGILGGQTGDQTGNEISVTEFVNSGTWMKVLRLPVTSGGSVSPSTNKRKGYNFILFNRRRRLGQW